jgi:hypothetical protein
VKSLSVSLLTVVTRGPVFLTRGPVFVTRGRSGDQGSSFRNQAAGPVTTGWSGGPGAGHVTGQVARGPSDHQGPVGRAAP